MIHSVRIIYIYKNQNLKTRLLQVKRDAAIRIWIRPNSLDIIPARVRKTYEAVL